MNIFVNPIAIKEGLQTIGFIRIPFSVNENQMRIIIRTTDGKMLVNQLIQSADMYSVDVGLSEVEVRIQDIKQMLDVYMDIFDLKKLAGKDADYNSKASIRKNEEEMYNYLYEKVSAMMDNPGGTPEELERHTEMLNKATKDARARQYVESKIREEVMREESLNASEIDYYTQKLYAYMYGMGVLQELDDDKEVGEIIVNCYRYPTFESNIYYYRNQKKYKYDRKFNSFEEMYGVFERAVSFENKELNSVENAQIETIRANRDRVNIIIPEASESYVMNIRKFGNFVPDLENMKKSGTIDDTLEKLISVLVRGKANIGIGGGMNTGKTTQINYMLTYTDKEELKVVVSSVAETDVERVLKGHHLVILNVNEEKGFTFNRQMRAALRTTASRVIVPEARGSEIRQVYEANVKTRGNIFTAHALEDEAFLDMITDMYLDGVNSNYEYIKQKLAKSMDIVVIMKTVGDKIRIKSLSELCFDEKNQYTHMNCLYEFVQDKEDVTNGYYRRTSNRMSERLKRKLNEFIPYSEIEDL